MLTADMHKQRLSRIQFTLSAGEQRAIDRGQHDADAQLHECGRTASRNWHIPVSSRPKGISMRDFRSNSARCYRSTVSRSTPCLNAIWTNWKNWCRCRSMCRPQWHRARHTEIEVPQWASYRLHERFHWPVDQVLLISFGVVATPVSVDPEMKLPFVSSPSRAELLVLAECRRREWEAAGDCAESWPAPAVSISRAVLKFGSELKRSPQRVPFHRALAPPHGSGKSNCVVFAATRLLNVACLPPSRTRQ